MDKVDIEYIVKQNSDINSALYLIRVLPEEYIHEMKKFLLEKTTNAHLNRYGVSEALTKIYLVDDQLACKCFDK